MSSSKWSRIKEIVAEALELGSEERSRFLEEACGGDRDVRGEVETLLGHEREGFLEPPRQERDTEEEDTEERSPRQIDGYRLLEKVGEGGMGEVWAAEQREPVHR